MAKEIEKKYLVDKSKWTPTSTGIKIIQGYLSTNSNSTIRVRIANNEGYITIKGKTSGISRNEYEYPIPYKDAEELLTLCKDNIIRKTRYKEIFEGMSWEVDVFEDKNNGLVMAEIELLSELQEFTIPEWIAIEVSHDKRYFNSNLSQNPYSTWEK